MDKDREITDELERLQSSLTTLFKSVINDKNKYKHEKERSMTSVDALLTEITILRKENEQLKKLSNGKNSCETCSKLKEELMIQDSKTKKLERNLDVLREMLCNMSYQNENPHVSKLLSKNLDEMIENVDVNNIKSRGQSSKISDNDGHGQLEEDNYIIYDTCDVKLSPVSKKASNTMSNVRNSKSEEKMSQKNDCVQAQTDESYLDLIMTADTKKRIEEMDAQFRTPKKSDKSEPDFIDTQYSALNEIKKGEKSPILIDQRFLMNKNSFHGSPSCLKRKSGEGISGSPAKFRSKTLFQQRSPKQRKYKSPMKGSRNKSASQLKGSNAIDAEISLSGVRKLKQTQLNPDFYKSTGKAGENVSDHGKLDLHNESRFGEDDLILESPKRSTIGYEEFRKTLKRDESVAMTVDDGKHSTPVLVQGSDFDPEETFVSSTFIKNSLKEEKLESAAELERSPEYNTIPNMYKGSPVRKKAERKKLPGHTCMECEKYYGAILDEMDQKKRQEILNQCSRHREQHYNIAETPPGYWKPYLTMTMETTENDDTID